MEGYMTNDTDAKEWVNIRIPEAVRDDAREDPRTYGEIMQAGLETDGPSVDTDSIDDLAALEAEIAKVQELVERVPETTADELEGRMR
jgi:hypothetical protein